MTALGHDPKTTSHHMSKALATQGVAVSKTSGQRCKQKAILGATVCRYHGGAAPQVKERAAVRAELMQWGLNDTTEDPGDVS